MFASPHLEIVGDTTAIFSARLSCRPVTSEPWCIARWWLDATAAGRPLRWRALTLPPSVPVTGSWQQEVRFQIFDVRAGQHLQCTCGVSLVDGATNDTGFAGTVPDRWAGRRIQWRAEAAGPLGNH